MQGSGLQLELLSRASFVRLTRELTRPRSRYHWRGSGEAIVRCSFRRRIAACCVSRQGSVCPVGGASLSSVAAAASGGSRLMRAHGSPRPLDHTPRRLPPRPLVSSVVLYSFFFHRTSYRWKTPTAVGGPQNVPALAPSPARPPPFLPRIAPGSSAIATNDYRLSPGLQPWIGPGAITTESNG